MVVLANYPIVSQKTQITTDKQPSEDFEFACVAASLGSAVLYYQHKQQWDSHVNPDMLKDSAMGQGYVGGTSAVRYTSVLDRLGFKLYPINGTPAQLVQAAHKQLQAGHPVIYTEPDPYVDASLGWSHVCAFFGETAGGLMALDPWPPKVVQNSDATWTAMLQFNQIWVVEPKGGHMPGVPTGWIESADKTRLWAPDNKFPVVRGFKAFIENNGWDADDFPIEAEHGASPLEMSNPMLGTKAIVSGTVQTFRKARLCWRSDTNTVYISWLGQELGWLASHVNDLTAQIAALQAQLKAVPTSGAGGLDPKIEADIKIMVTAFDQLRKDAGL